MTVMKVNLDLVPAEYLITGSTVDEGRVRLEQQ